MTNKKEEKKPDDGLTPKERWERLRKRFKPLRTESVDFDS